MPRKYALISLHAAVLLFGLSALIGKFLTLSPAFIVFSRASIAALSILMLRAIGGSWVKIDARDLPVVLILGLVLAVHWITFFHSIQVSTVAIALLSYSSFPIFVTFLEPVLFRERLNLKNVLTSCVVCFGLILVVPNFDISSNLTVGLLWGILSALSFAVLSLGNRKFAGRYPADTMASWLNLVAGVILAPLVVANWPELSATDVALLCVLGIFCTACAHSLFIFALQFVTARTASVAASLESVYGIAFAYIVLAEVPTLRMMIGGIIILSTIVISSSWEKLDARSDDFNSLSNGPPIPEGTPSRWSE